MIMQAIPDSRLPIVAFDALGQLWPTMQKVLIEVNVGVVREHICAIFDLGLAASAASSESQSFLPLLWMFLETCSKVKPHTPHAMLPPNLPSSANMLIWKSLSF
jgi:hypothetical protein